MQVGDAKALHTQQRSSGVDLSNPSLAEAWKEVRNSGSGVNWCLFGYEGASKDKFCVFKKGTGGGKELCRSLDDDQALFGGFQITADGRERFVFVSFIGDNLGGMKKGRASLHTQALSNFCEGCVGTVTGTCAQDMSGSLEADVKSLLGRSTKVVL